MAKVTWQRDYHKSHISLMQVFMSIWDQLIGKAAELVSADVFQGCIDVLLEKGCSSVI